jgi:hypothetical protein
LYPTRSALVAALSTNPQQSSQQQEWPALKSRAANIERVEIL